MRLKDTRRGDIRVEREVRAERHRTQRNAPGLQAFARSALDTPSRGATPRADEANARMRREGTRNLLAAAEAAGASHFVAQSIAWQVPGDAGAAVAELERLVLAANGVVLRYGRLYGPGTYYEHEKPEPPRVHVDEAARRTVPALDATAGVVEVIGD